MLNKNKKWGLSLLILLLIIIPQLSFASFISLESPNETIDVGQSFNLSVYIDPASSVVYTAQVELDFSTDSISVDSFSYSDKWMPVTQPGYDLIDNNNGKLIKTAGFPNGFDKKLLLGTAILTLKKAGPVDLTINKKSAVLDADSKNTLSEDGSISISSQDEIILESVDNDKNNDLFLGGIVLIVVLGGAYYSVKKKTKNI